MYIYSVKSEQTYYDYIQTSTVIHIKLFYIYIVK